MNILMLTHTPNVDDNLPTIIYDDGDAETFPERAKAYFEKDVLAETADGIQLNTHWDDEKHCGQIVYPDGSSIQYICSSARDLSSAMEENS